MFGNVREHIFGMTTIWLISEVTWKVMESFADSGLSSVGNLPEYIYIYIIYYGNFNEENAKPMWILGEQPCLANLRFERFADCECEIKCLVISVLVGWLGLRLIFRQMNRSSVQKMSATSDTTARATDNNGQCLHPVFAVSYPQSRQDARLTQSDSSEQSSS